MGLNVEVRSVANPRKEAEEHYYNPVHSGLLELGLEPNLLTDETLVQMMEVVLRHKDNIDIESIFRGVKWG